MLHAVITGFLMQDQDSLLVKHQTDNNSPGPQYVAGEISP